MTLPVFDATRHSIGLDGIGFMRATGPGVSAGTIQRQDVAPNTTRAAQGEGRFDSFQTESFVAQADWRGGVGQRRFVSTDAFLSGVGDSRFGGQFFPQRKQLTGTLYTDSYWFAIGNDLYGFNAANISKDGTNTFNIAVPTTQPIVLGSNTVLVHSTTHIYRWAGSGSGVDVTPAGYTPKLLARYGKYAMCLATRPVKSAIAQVQAVSVPVDNVSSKSINWKMKTKPGNLLLLAVSVDDVTTGALYPPGYLVPDGWALAEEAILNDNGTPFYDRTALFYKEGARAQDGAVTVEFDVPHNGALWLAEYEGIANTNALDVYVHAVNATPSGTPASGTTSSSTVAKALGVALFGVGGSHTATYSNSYVSQAAQGQNDVESTLLVATKILAATGTQTTTATLNTGTSEYAALLAVFKGNGLSSDASQFTVLLSSDDGLTWSDAFDVSSTGIPTPTAAIAGGGSLWFTTANELYQLSIAEREFEDHTTTVDIALRSVDQWAVTYDGKANHICFWQGGVYYSVGSTIRRYTINAIANEIWPTDGWATVTGAVGAMIQDEGGVYFAAAGYLWNYDGRGFHQLGSTANSTDCDALIWHRGKLYGLGNPAPFWDYKYPHTRPDVVYLTPNYFDTSYMVMSLLDFDKMAVIKIIREFSVQVRWTAASDAGSVTLAYLADPPVDDPGRSGGGATSLSWVSIGTFNDPTTSTKRFTIDPPIECTRLFIRATLTPGASNGYPILEGVTIYGRSVMPTVSRFVTTLGISTATRDITGTQLYPTADDVNEAIDKLTSLRAGVSATNHAYFTASFKDELSDVTDYIVSAEQRNDWLTSVKGDHGLGWNCTFSMVEIP